MQSQKIWRYATYDASLKKLKDGEITIPGENTKNKRSSDFVRGGKYILTVETEYEKAIRKVIMKK